MADKQNTYTFKLWFQSWRNAHEDSLTTLNYILYSCVKSIVIRIVRIYLFAQDMKLDDILKAKDLH